MATSTPAGPLAFITGASSGIGQALALHAARRGWRLALVARRADAVAAWAAASGIAPERLSVHAADVRDVAAIGAAAAAVVAGQGLPDVVVANAGISIGVDVGDAADLDVMRATWETNNLGLAATFQPFVAPMRRRGAGALVGIASVAGIRGLPGHAAYCSSKAGVIAFCESLRGDLRRSGVRVVTIAPGYIATPLTSGNRYAMPFLMSAEDFAERAWRAIDAGASWRVIPWQMGVVARLLRIVPDGLFDRLASGRGRKKRLGE